MTALWLRLLIESANLRQSGKLIISDKIIGKARVEIPFTDISLVDLDKDIEFVNQSFENSDGVVPNSGWRLEAP